MKLFLKFAFVREILTFLNIFETVLSLTKIVNWGAKCPPNETGDRLTVATF